MALTISPLPTPPSRADSPAGFSDDADAFIGALPTFQSEANALASEAETNAELSKDWATDATITGGSSKSWATKTGAIVDGDYSSKEYATGTTVPTGSAKTHADAALSSKNDAETAQGLSETAQGLSEAARDLSETYKDQAQTAAAAAGAAAGLPSLVGNAGKVLRVADSETGAEWGTAGFDYTETTDPLSTTNPANVGASWSNTTSGQLFICTDNTTNANVWVGQGSITTQKLISEADFTNVVNITFDTGLDVYDELRLDVSIDSVDGGYERYIQINSLTTGYYTNMLLVTTGATSGQSYNSNGYQVIGSIGAVAGLSYHSCTLFKNGMFRATWLCNPSADGSTFITARPEGRRLSLETSINKIVFYTGSATCTGHYTLTGVKYA